MQMLCVLINRLVGINPFPKLLVVIMKRTSYPALYNLATTAKTKNVLLKQLMSNLIRWLTVID